MELDTKVLHGATKIIPPRSLDQGIETQEELEEWFAEEVLGGRDDLTYKLELLSVIDLRRALGRDNAEDNGGQFEMNTINDLFETTPVIPTQDLLDILARSDRVSMEEELRENIALLALPYASEGQFRTVLKNQPSLQKELGDVTQISNTDESRIKRALSSCGVEGADELAAGIKEEAIKLNRILDLD